MRELGMTVTLSSRSLRSMWSCFVRPESDTSASSRVAASSSILKATMTERLLLHGRFALRLRDMTHRLIELSCDRPFSARHQVDVTVRHRLPRMSEARSYRGYRHAHRHEHGGVAVAQVVDPYAPHLCRFSAPRHLVVEEVLGHAREYPRVRVRYRVHHQVLVELLGEKSRHGDRPVRLRSLRGGGEDVFASDPRDRLAHLDLRRLEIDVGRRESEHLPDAEPAPEQDLEGQMGIGLVGDCVGESQVLLLGPDVHLAPFLGTDLSGDLDRVAFESVEANEMVHDRRQLAAKRVQVRCRVRLALGGAALQ